MTASLLLAPETPPVDCGMIFCAGTPQEIKAARIAKARSIESCMATPGLPGMIGARATIVMRLLLVQKCLMVEIAFGGSIALLGAKSILAAGGQTRLCSVTFGVGLWVGAWIGGDGGGDDCVASFGGLTGGLTTGSSGL